MKVYRVYDDEWEGIMGSKQIREFATSQIYNAPDDFTEENLKDFYNYKSIINLANKVLDDNYKIKTMKQVDKVFSVRYFEYEELNVY